MCLLQSSAYVHEGNTSSSNMPFSDSGAGGLCGRGTLRGVHRSDADGFAAAHDCAAEALDRLRDDLPRRLHGADTCGSVARQLALCLAGEGKQAHERTESTPRHQAPHTAHRGTKPPHTAHRGTKPPTQHTEAPSPPHSTQFARCLPPSPSPPPPTCCLAEVGVPRAGAPLSSLPQHPACTASPSVHKRLYGARPVAPRCYHSSPSPPPPPLQYLQRRVVARQPVLHRRLQQPCLAVDERHRVLQPGRRKIKHRARQGDRGRPPRAAQLGNRPPSCLVLQARQQRPDGAQVAGASVQGRHRGQQRRRGVAAACERLNERRVSRFRRRRGVAGVELECDCRSLRKRGVAGAEERTAAHGACVAEPAAAVVAAAAAPVAVAEPAEQVVDAVLYVRHGAVFAEDKAVARCEDPVAVAAHRQHAVAALHCAEQPAVARRQQRAVAWQVDAVDAVEYLRYRRYRQAPGASIATAIVTVEEMHTP
eukprot:27708-Chlamydomonas_euryale.AAC.4